MSVKTPRFYQIHVYPLAVLTPDMHRIERRAKYFPQLLEIAETLDSKPPTAATIPIQDCADKHTGHLENWDLLPLRTWFVPTDRFTHSSNTSRRIVNPQAPDASLYTDISASVNFDQIITNPRQISAEEVTESIREARQELTEKRLSFLEDATSHFYTTEDCGIRMDLKGTSVYNFADRHDFPFTEKRLEGRDKIVAEWEHLRQYHGYAYSDIATVYQTSKGTVCSYVNDDSIGGRKTLKG